MNLWLGLPAILAAVGVGLVALGGGRWAYQTWQSFSRRRLWRPLIPKNTESGKPIPPESLFDLPPLAPWMVLGMILGLGLSHILLYGPLRFVGVAGGLLPLFWKRQQIHQGRQRIQREIADLVATLRIYLGFAVTAGTALRLAIDDGRSGILWAQLRHHRDQATVQALPTVLEEVAEELDSADLRRLLTRVRAARAGATGLDAALRAVAVDITAELHQELGEQVEAAPTRLIVPLLATLLPPLLILLLSPALQAFLDTLAGVGPLPLGR